MDNDETNEYTDFDVKGAAAEIGADLFKAPVKDVLYERGTAPPATVVAETPDLQVAPVDKTPVVDPNTPKPRVEVGVNSETPANPTLAPLPKSWKKEMQGAWEKADPTIHAYVAEREAQVMRGIQQYGAGHNNWNALIQPFAPLLSQNPEVNPIQLIQGLMNTHLQLLNPNGDPKRKVDLINSLLNEYGIDIGQGGTPADQRTNQEIQNLRAELAAVKHSQTQSQQKVYSDNLATNHSMVETFSKDPKNKYFDEVGHDILRFIQSGAAPDLASAYELACYANPAVRAKLLAEQPANQKPNNIEKPRKPNGQFINVDETPVKQRAPKQGTIDNTIDNIVAKHYSAH